MHPDLTHIILVNADLWSILVTSRIWHVSRDHASFEGFVLNKRGKGEGRRESGTCKPTSLPLFALLESSFFFLLKESCLLWCFDVKSRISTHKELMMLLLFLHVVYLMVHKRGWEVILCSVEGKRFLCLIQDIRALFWSTYWTIEGMALVLRLTASHSSSYAHTTASGATFMPSGQGLAQPWTLKALEHLYDFSY